MRFGLIVTLVSCMTILSIPAANAAVESETRAPKQLSDVGKGKTPGIAERDGGLYVAYQNDSAIFCSISADAGKTWKLAAKVSGALQDCAHPSIATGKDSSINIVFEAKSAPDKVPGVFFTRSSDNGKTFSEPFDISDTPTKSSEPHIAIAADDSLHVTWIDALPAPAGPDVYYRASKDGGKTWSKREDVSNTPGGTSSNPTIAPGSDGKVYIAWSDTTSGDESPDIFYSFKSGASSWSEPEDLSKDPGYSACPNIACGAKDKLYVVWTDNSKKNSGDIFCLVQDDKKGFGKPINLSNSRGISSQPSLSVDKEDQLAVVWIDTSATMKVPDIWGKTAAKGKFSKAFRLCSTDAESIHPAVVISNEKAFTVWEESEAGGSTIKACELPIKETAEKVKH